MTEVEDGELGSSQPQASGMPQSPAHVAPRAINNQTTQQPIKVPPVQEPGKTLENRCDNERSSAAMTAFDHHSTVLKVKR